MAPPPQAQHMVLTEKSSSSKPSSSHQSGLMVYSEQPSPSGSLAVPSVSAHPDSDNARIPSASVINNPGVVGRRRRWVSDTESLARITGSHCGGQAKGWSTATSLLVTLGSVVCGRKAAQKAVATLMRTSARKLGVSFFAYRLKWGNPAGQGRTWPPSARR